MLVGIVDPQRRMSLQVLFYFADVVGFDRSACIAQVLFIASFLSGALKKSSQPSDHRYC